MSNKDNSKVDYLSCLAGLGDKVGVPNEVLEAVRKNDKDKANELLKKYDNEIGASDKISLQDIINDKTSLIGVWSKGKHREVIFDPFRVIVNDKTDENEAEILVITNTWVYRITPGNDGNFNIAHTKINEVYDINGRKVSK